MSAQVCGIFELREVTQTRTEKHHPLLSHKKAYLHQGLLKKWGPLRRKNQRGSKGKVGQHM